MDKESGLETGTYMYIYNIYYCTVRLPKVNITFNVTLKTPIKSKQTKFANNDFYSFILIKKPVSSFQLSVN